MKRIKKKSYFLDKSFSFIHELESNKCDKNNKPTTNIQKAGHSKYGFKKIILQTPTLETKLLEMQTKHSILHSKNNCLYSISKNNKTKKGLVKLPLTFYNLCPISYANLIQNKCEFHCNEEEENKRGYTIKIMRNKEYDAAEALCILKNNYKK